MKKIFCITTAVLLSFPLILSAAESAKLNNCAKNHARLNGYHIAGIDSEDGNFYDVRLELKPGSTISIRDIVEKDEGRGGHKYDSLVAMRASIKACAGFHGRLDISDFDGAAIAKDR